MKQIKNAVIGLTLLLILSAFIDFDANVDKGYQIGDVVSDFKLMNVNEEMVSLSHYKEAKGFIIVFTCNTCPFARVYEDRIIQINNKYASQGYPVIAIMPNNPAIATGDSFEAMKERAKNKGYTFPYLMDRGQNVYPQFGATKTPHVFVLQNTKKGNIVEYIGAIDDNYKDASAVNHKYVEDAVNALLEGEEVSLKETKAIGCSIK